MDVPITSDLGGYRVFWQFWFGLLVMVVAAVGVMVVGLLVAIWRRLG